MRLLRSDQLEQEVDLRKGELIETRSEELLLKHCLAEVLTLLAQENDDRFDQVLLSLQQQTDFAEDALDFVNRFFFLGNLLEGLREFAFEKMA